MTREQAIALDSNENWKAFKEGKTIQYRYLNAARWEDVTNVIPENMLLNPELYRVKPKPREFWVNLYRDKLNGAHESKETADMLRRANRIECVHVREVL